MTILAALFASFLCLIALWRISASALQRLAGQALVLWVPVFGVGVLWMGALLPLALFLSWTALLLYVRSVWSDDDDDDFHEEPEPWGFLPENPLDKRKRSKTPF